MLGIVVIKVVRLVSNFFYFILKKKKTRSGFEPEYSIPKFP